MSDETSFRSWAVLELMGHRRIIGEITEVQIAGGKLLRVDVPESGDQPAYSQFYGAGSVYCLSPVDEAVARRLLERADTAPFYAYALKALPAPGGNGAADDNDMDDVEDGRPF